MRIVMDDAGDVPADLVEKYNLKIVPINVIFGTEEFLSGLGINHNTFYEKVKEVGDHNFPKTSQPTPYQFEEAYRQLLAEGASEILTVTVSEKLSGTYASAEAAARELAGQASSSTPATFHLFDSAGGSAAQGFMVIEAARLAAAGVGIDAILARLTEIRDKMAVYFLINSLEYAVKGGRVSALRSTMASLLNIKPIMQLKDGVIVEAGKVRTFGKALDAIVELVRQKVGDQPIKVAYIHARAPEGAAELQQRARQRLNMTEELTVDMALGVAINLGPGALGIVAIPA